MLLVALARGGAPSPPPGSPPWPPTCLPRAPCSPPHRGRLAALGAAPDDSGADEQTRARRERMRQELTAFVDYQPDEIAQLVSGWLAERKG